MPGESSDNGISIAICCVGKPGSDNMTDWINHHLELGFDHIFIYNGGTLDGYRTEFDVQPIEGVTIVDFPYNVEKDYGTAAYAHCYRENRSDYDWIAYINPYEYIMLSKHESIKDVFSERDYSKFEVVRMNVVDFSDYIQFTRDFDFKADAVVTKDEIKATKKNAKSIVNCKSKGILFKSYTPTRNGEPLRQCLPNLVEVKDNRDSNTVKGVDVNKVDTSIMYVTPNQLEVLWVNWKRSRGYDKNSREAVMARGTPTFQRYKYVIL